MQSVVRSSFIGLLAIAGLTACGDKVTQQTGDNVVHSVTVTPNNVPNLAVGGSVTLAASVDAGSGVTDRTVTWSSSDATIASVDAATGKVTGVKAGGPVTITAAAKANPDVKGAAVVTVGGAGGAVPTVTISNINQTVCGVVAPGLPPICSSVPATLTNVSGQLDVTLNVESNGQALKSVQATLKCGTDSVTQTQTISANVAELDASAAAAPVTLSFNTAAFSPTGVVALRNGQCTISASATTTSGTQSALTSQQFTLNNADMAIVTVSSTNAATDPANRPWIGGGPLTISAIPVMYSGRTAVGATIGFTTDSVLPNTTPPSSQSQTLTALAAGAFTATWSNGPTAPSVQNWAARGITPIVSISDASGASTTSIGSLSVKGGTTTTTSTTGRFNFDAQKPPVGTFSVLTNLDQGISGGSGYVGANFRFAADSAAGYRGPNAGQINPFIGGTYGATGNADNGGVDKVTVTFQFRVNGVNPYVNVTNTSTIQESAAFNTYQLRMLTIDAVGNADTSAAQTFGVDKTPPVVTVSGGPADRATTTTPGSLGSYVFSIGDALSSTNGTALVAQVRQWNGLAISTANEGRINTNITGTGFTLPGTSGSATTSNPCWIGRFNAAQSAAGPNAIAVFSASGATVGWCTPVLYNISGNSIPAAGSTADGYWWTTVVALDVAGNQASPTTRVIAQDATIPTIANIDMPASVTGNATVGFPARAQDSVGTSIGDIVASWGTVNYVGAGISLRYATTAGPGVAFDNVLTNVTTATPQIPNFIKSLQTNAGFGTPVIAPGSSNPASSITVAAQDEVGNAGTATAPFTAGVTQLIPGSSTDIRQCLTGGTACTTQAFNQGFLLSKADASVSNCASCSPSLATATVLTATAAGVSGQFTNPFVGGAVQIWYRVQGSGSAYFLAGTAGPGLSRDNGAFRAWDYAFTFDPPLSSPIGNDLTVAGTVIEVIAIGVNSAGDAVATAPQTITIANP